MELTKNEIEIAERWISKRERQVAQWPYRRWLILAIFAVFALLGIKMVSDGMGSIQEEKDTDFALSRAVGDSPSRGQEQIWTAGTMMKISKILEARQNVVAYALLEVALGYLEILSGLIMVCLVLLRWNTAPRDLLICKVLRGKLQELETSKK